MSGSALVPPFLAGSLTTLISAVYLPVSVSLASLECSSADHILGAKPSENVGMLANFGVAIPS